MKKFLSLILMALACAMAYATDVTITASELGLANQTVMTGSPVTVDGVTLTFDKGTGTTAPTYYSNGTNFRVYRGNTLTITAPGNITSVAFSFTGSYNANNATWSEGTYAAGTWTGNAATVVMTNSGSSQVRITKLVVTYSGEAPAVAAPTIEAVTPFDNTTTVTLATTTEGAAIYYTLDGTDPTEASTLYSAPFTVSESCTVKAVAVINGQTSVVASKELVKNAAIATVADIAALADGTSFTYTGTAVVTYQNASRLFFRDGNGAAGLIFGTAGQTYNNGDVIPAGWQGSKTVYNGVLEVSSPSGLQAATTTADAYPVEIAVAQASTDLCNEYVVIKNVAVSSDGTTITDGTDNLVGYNQFKITLPEISDSKKYDVTGVMTVYKNAPELYLLNVEETTATGVDEVNAAKTVQSVRYYNLAGQQSAEPFTGVNIVATTYTDGTSTAMKQIVK